MQYSPATSCQELVNAGYSSGSGKYWIKENHWTYSAHHYCVMPTKDGETAVDIGGNGLNENGAGKYKVSRRKKYDMARVLR